MSKLSKPVQCSWWQGIHVVQKWSIADTYPLQSAAEASSWDDPDGYRNLAHRNCLHTWVPSQGTATADPLLRQFTCIEQNSFRSQNHIIRKTTEVAIYMCDFPRWKILLTSFFLKRWTSLTPQHLGPIN